MARICIVNVGVNTKHEPLRSPRLPDGRFEFVPIPEEVLNRVECPRAPRYRDLHPVTDLPVEAFIPRTRLSQLMHNDPEFSTFTYGDYLRRPRAANIARLTRGDMLLFYARLVEWKNGFTRRAGFYFVGRFMVDRIYGPIKERPPASVLRRIRRNMHIIRGECDRSQYDGFWVVKGSQKSTRYEIAVPFNRKLIEKCRLRDSRGRPIRWSRFGTELRTIGTYFRAARLIADKDVVERLRDHVEDRAFE